MDRRQVQEGRKGRGGRGSRLAGIGLPTATPSPLVAAAVGGTRRDLAAG